MMDTDAFGFSALSWWPLYHSGVVVSLIALAIGAFGIYNLFLHPLRNYPGPMLWAAYRIPYVFRACQGRLPFIILEFHRKYGPIVRVAPNELAFNDGKAWQDLQGLLPDRRQNAKDFSAYSPLPPGAPKSVITADDEAHARLRRIYGPAFTPKAVLEQVPMLTKYADLLVSTLKLSIQQNGVQDMSAFYNFVSFDLIGEFAFDESFHCLDRGGKSHVRTSLIAILHLDDADVDRHMLQFFVKTIFDGVLVGFRIMQLEGYGFWSMLQPLLPKSIYQAKADLDNYSAELVDRRRERGYVHGKADVMNYLLQNKAEGDRLTRAELVENGIVLVAAGSETTATLLTATTWLLCKNPEKHRKVVEEVRSAFQKDEDIISKSVNNLSYMLAALNEAMRVFPPSAFGFPRIISSKGGQSIADYHVPEKTICTIFHYAVYHDERNFARPDEFIPERWLPDVPPEFANDARDALQPFHVGPRGCLGKNLAYAEMRLILVKMLWHFDLDLAGSYNDWSGSLKAISIWERTSLNVRLKVVQR